MKELIANYDENAILGENSLSTLVGMDAKVGLVSRVTSLAIVT